MHTLGCGHSCAAIDPSGLVGLFDMKEFDPEYKVGKVRLRRTRAKGLNGWSLFRFP